MQEANDQQPHWRHPWAKLRPSIGQFVWGSNEAPDFEKSVTVVLATFTVFTGYTINLFLKEINVTNLSDWKWWAFVAFVTLLLRYIFGSAIHLNATYVGKTIYIDVSAEGVIPPHSAQKKIAPKSQCIFMLFKDFLFLVFFGMLAIHIVNVVQSPASGSVAGGVASVHSAVDDIKQAKMFAHRAMWFVGAGFAWSISDYYIRRVWCLFTREHRAKDWRPSRVADTVFFAIFAYLAIDPLTVAYGVVFEGKNIDSFICEYAVIIAFGFIFAAVNWLVERPHNAPDGEWPGPFWRIWVALDGIQFLVTSLIVAFVENALRMTQVVAVVFIVFLFLDLGAMIRAVQLRLK